MFTFFLTCFLLKMTTASNKELIEKYAPIVYFHSDEKYLPLDMNIVLQNSTLKDFKNDVIITSPSNRELYEYSKKEQFKPRGDGSLVLSIDNNLYNHSYPLHEQPIYSIVRNINGKTYILYILFFPYNGDYTILRHGRAGSHPADFEHYTVELSSDNKLERVFFGAHGNYDGRWVKKDDLQFEHGKIVVFSSLNGHGLYHKEGVAFRIGGLANDYLERGQRWSPRVFELFNRDSSQFDIDTMGWFAFNGRFGGNLNKPNTEGVMGPIDKVWYGENGELVDDLDETKYNSPKILSNKVMKPLFFAKDSITITLIYATVFFLMIYLDKYVRVFHENPFLKSLVAIMFLKLTYTLVSDNNNMVLKHLVALLLLLYIIHYFQISQKMLYERI
jgi:hypothetical protein